MWTKIVVVISFMVFALGGFYYFLVDSSYSKSLEAKFLFYEERYDEALELAQLAYNEDNYNRMAFTIVTQSKEAKRWEQYIEESTEYILRAKEIAEKDTIGKADRLEIKIMAEIVIGGYLTLNKLSPFISDEFKQKAKYLYDQFKELHDELSQE